MVLINVGVTELYSTSIEKSLSLFKLSFGFQEIDNLIILCT
jgi:hypothetical protein